MDDLEPEPRRLARADAEERARGRPEPQLPVSMAQRGAEVERLLPGARAGIRARDPSGDEVHRGHSPRPDRLVPPAVGGRARLSRAAGDRRAATRSSPGWRRAAKAGACEAPRSAGRTTRFRAAMPSWSSSAPGRSRKRALAATRAHSPSSPQVNRRRPRIAALAAALASLPLLAWGPPGDLPSAELAGTTSVPRPRIAKRLIPYGPERQADMAAYSKRHYGESASALTDPKLIVIHYAEAGSLSSIFNTFAPNRPDVEYGEKPGVCSHFAVGSTGRIERFVPDALRCRHVVGLNHVSLGIEHVGFSDRDVLGSKRELRASLKLTQWLRCHPRAGHQARDRAQREPRLALLPRARPRLPRPHPRRLPDIARCASTAASCASSGPC